MSRKFFRTLAREAAEGYPRRDRTAHHFAYGKLAGDPAFAHLLRARVYPDGARVLDLGCGQGLLAALLAAAHVRHAGGNWPGDWPPPPRIASFTGIELRERDVERARLMSAHWATKGAQGSATFIAGDIRSTPFPAADVVVILDVLHYIDYAAQAEVLRRVRVSLSPRGSLLLRVGDESPTLRFRYTIWVDRLSMRLRGHRLPRLWCRPVAAWKSELENLGFKVHAEPMSAGTPFANVLLAARYDEPV